MTRTLGFVLSAWCAALGLSGCKAEAEALTKFVTDPDKKRAVDWEPGTTVRTLSIDGVYGDVDLKRGTDGEIGVVFSPFNYRGTSEEARATDELKNDLTREIAVQGSAVKIWTARAGFDGLGAAITVFVPPDFDGELVVHNRGSGSINPGDVNVAYVGKAHTLTLNNDRLGTCSVGSAGSLTKTRVKCDGDAVLNSVADHVDINVSGLNHTTTVVLGSIKFGAPGSTIIGEKGNVLVTFPRDAVFATQALAKKGTVDEGAPRGACRVEEASPASKTVTCGSGGPVFEVTSGEGDVKLSYK